MAEWKPVAHLDDLPKDRGLVAEVRGRLIAIFRENDQVFAIDDCCPHAGAPLSEGYFCEGTVTCPWHAWRFRVSDGLWMDAPKSGTKVPTYPARIDGDQVLVEIDW